MSTSINAHNVNAAKMWGSPGRKYDAISRFVSSGIEHCVERLRPAPGEYTLDLATGTGWTSRRLASWGARAIGVDISEGMLNAAKEIAAQRNLDIEYRVADAESLPFADGEFDAVISTFGAMFAPDREAVASELARVCRKGGRLAMLCWTPESGPVKMRQILAPYAPPPPSPPPPSPFDWGRPDWVEKTLGDAFDLGFEQGTLYHRVPDGNAGWDELVEGFGPVYAVAQSLDDERLAAAKADMAALFDGYKDGLGVAFPCEYLVIVGVRR
jgi:SAM-dependent methyltransferase